MAAEHIAAAFQGREPVETFDGVGASFLETGNGEAVMVHGQSLAQPAPQVALTAASADFLERKRAFASEFLAPLAP